MPLYPKQQPPYYQEQEDNTTIGIYRAFITQTSTNNPIATTILNTIQDDDPTWTRNAIGVYDCTFLQNIPINKWIVKTGMTQNDTAIQAAVTSGDKTIRILQSNITGSRIDGLTHQFIEISYIQ